MERFFEDYLDRLRKLHDDIQRAIDGLSQEALDWVPGLEMNSIGVLVVHVAGAERYWIGDVVAREPSGRDRAAEFRVQGSGAEALQQRLMDSLAYIRGVLEGLTLQDLADVRASPRDGRPFTVGWALAHTLEHTAVHTGHIGLTRQLWEQRKR